MREPERAGTGDDPRGVAPPIVPAERVAPVRDGGWLRGVVAHRGAPRLHRDNTLDGISAAVRLGAAAVEVDVRLTADGVPVLHHGVALPRHPWWPWGGPAVGALAFDRLRAREPRVPTLAEALDAVRGSGVPLVLDVGTIEAAHACLAALADAEGPTGSATAWFCGAAGALAWIREQDGDRPLLLSWQDRSPPPPALVAQVAPTMFNPRHRWVGPVLVERWHGAGVGVCTWTVDRSRRRAQLLGWGVDAVISNDVAAAVRDVRAARPGR